MTGFSPTVGMQSAFPSEMATDHAEIPIWNAESWLYDDWQTRQKNCSLRRTTAKGQGNWHSAASICRR